MRKESKDKGWDHITPLIRSGRDTCSPQQKGLRQGLGKAGQLERHKRDRAPESLKRSMHFLKQVFCILHGLRHTMSSENK
jgi:hypothetical protein